MSYIALLSFASFIVSYKIKNYTEHNNLFAFNNQLNNAKILFITALKEQEQNKTIFDFAVETLLNTCDIGCYFYYKGHYNNKHFEDLFKDDIIKYYKENYTDDSNVSIALKYSYLRQFVLENDLTTWQINKNIKIKLQKSK